MPRPSQPRTNKSTLKAFNALRQNAKNILADKERLAALLKAVAQFARAHEASLKKAREELATLSELVRAYCNGSYREVPWKTALNAVLALAYLLSPFDAIPDFLPIIGFTDDVAVISMVCAQLAMI